MKLFITQSKQCMLIQKLHKYIITIFLFLMIIYLDVHKENYIHGYIIFNTQQDSYTTPRNLKKTCNVQLILKQIYIRYN